MDLEITPWSEHSLPNRALLAHDVEVWVLRLDVPEWTVQESMVSLSPDEKTRGLRFVFEPDRRRFAVSRAFLRRMLGARTGTSPERVRLWYGPRGKPRLEGAADEALRFNLSHSGEIAVLALSGSLDLGIDVEVIRPVPEALAIARTVFPKREVEALAALPADQLPREFLRGWTRVEASVKAAGGGLALLGSTRSSDVAFCFEAAVRPRCARDRWMLYDFEPSAGYVGALAVAAGRHRVLAWSTDAALGITRT